MLTLVNLGSLQYLGLNGELVWCTSPSSLVSSTDYRKSRSVSGKEAKFFLQFLKVIFFQLPWHSEPYCNVVSWFKLRNRYHTYICRLFNTHALRNFEKRQTYVLQTGENLVGRITGALCNPVVKCTCFPLHWKNSVSNVVVFWALDVA